MRLSRAAVAGAVVAATLLSSGVTYAATARPNIPTASAVDTVVTSTSNKSIGSTGSTWVTILAVNLPAGDYVLHASGDLVNNGLSDYARCEIVVGAQHIAGVSTWLGVNGLSAVLLSPFALVGGAVIVTGTTAQASLRCEHDHSNGAAPYVDADASLWVHKTTSLRLATE